MDSLTEERRIPVLNLQEGDAAVVFVFGMVGLFVVPLIASVAGMEVGVVPLVAMIVGLCFGGGLVYVTPEHLTAAEWLGSAWRFLKRPSVTLHAPEQPSLNARENAAEPNEGGLANYTPFAPTERTQDLVNLERAWPGVGAIERPDGAMEAYVEIEPDNMDFAMTEDWAQLQATAAEFANNELGFALTFHASTQAFPVEDIVDRIDDRMADEDVQQNPIFQELLEEYRDERPAEMRRRGIQEVRYYLGVRVDRLEVYNEYDDDASTPLERLTEIPVVGVLFNPFVTRRKNLTEDEHRVEMFDLLDERIRAVQTELIQNVSGWSSRRLSTVELFLLSMSFWNDEADAFGDVGALLGESGVSDHRSRVNADD